MGSKTNRQRGQYARTALRREQISQAALSVVEEKGHENLTTAEVARVAGSAEATVLYHFPTRDHLLVAALTHWDAQADAAIPVTSEPAWDLDALAQFARAAVEEERVLRLYIAISGLAAVPGHPALEYFTEHYREAQQRFTALVAARQRSGEADAGLDPEAVARQILATWDGLNLHWLVSPTFDVGEALVSAVRRLTGQDWMESRRAVIDSLSVVERS